MHEKLQHGLNLIQKLKELNDPRLSPKRTKSFTWNDNFIRLSLGLEDAEDLGLVNLVICRSRDEFLISFLLKMRPADLKIM